MHFNITDMQLILVEYIGENIKQDHMYTVSEKYKNKNSKLMNIISYHIKVTS